jgi:hypothetical protein
VTFDTGHQHPDGAISMPKTTESENCEMFSFDEKGKKVDAHIHDEILDNPEAEDNNARHTLKRLISEGYPEEMIRDIARQFDENQLKRKPKLK